MKKLIGWILFFIRWLVTGIKLLYQLIKYLFEDLGCISRSIIYLIVTYSITVNSIGYGYIDYGLTAVACIIYLIIRGIIRYPGHKEKEAKHKAYLDREKKLMEYRASQLGDKDAKLYLENEKFKENIEIAKRKLVEIYQASKSDNKVSVEIDPELEILNKNVDYVMRVMSPGAELRVENGAGDGIDIIFKKNKSGKFELIAEVQKPNPNSV